MNQRLDKYYNKIGVCATLFLVATILIFFLGPIKWIENWNIYNTSGIILLVIYISMFALGFFSNKRNDIDLVYIESNEIREDNKYKSLRLLKYSLWIVCFIVIWNALEYSSSSSISELINNAINGLANPATVYYMKDTSSRFGSLITFVNLFFQPLVYVTLVLGIYYFKHLGGIQKALYIFTVLVEVLRWIALGTNKGLLDVIFIFVAAYILKVADKDVRMSKSKKRIIFIVICISIILFLVFFGNAMNDRVRGAYDLNNFIEFPYNMIPESMRVLVEKVDSYLTQGYANMFKCMEFCDFKWTYGVGNSRFLTSVVERIFGVDIFSRTFPAQLAAYGVDPLASWHSAYSWFASDIGFLGIIFLMFFVGRYFSSVLQDAVLFHDTFSITIFYFLLLAIVNSSCTNYVLAYINMFSGIIILSFLRWLKKKNIAII